MDLKQIKSIIKVKGMKIYLVVLRKENWVICIKRLYILNHLSKI